MKTIGLIGGMSWESSAVYYNIMNKKTAELLGGFHSAKSVMVSVDFAEIESLQHKNDWKSLEKVMISSAQQLESAGADFVLLCTNSLHFCAKEIAENINIPFLHIAEATGLKITERKIKKVALLGTRFTMEMDFYSGLLTDKFGIEVVMPDEDDRIKLHRIIYDELVLGKVLDKSRKLVKEMISQLVQKGAEGVILGCTEIPMLISDSDVEIPVFNTTKIHAEKAVEWAVRES